MDLKCLPKDKKGMSIGDLYPVILTIITVAILIAVGLVVMQKFQETTSDDAYSRVNETLGAMNSTLNANNGTFVTNATSCGFSNFVVTRVVNATGPGSDWTKNTDYTFVTTGDDAGMIVPVNIDIRNTETAVTYSWTQGGNSCTALDAVTDDFTDFVPWIGVILLIIAAAIVLGVLIRSMGQGRV